MMLTAAVQSFSATIGDALINICGSKHSQAFVEGLRQESDPLFQMHGIKLSMNRVDRPFRTDSA